MKTLQDLISSIPSYAADIKTNLENLISEKNTRLNPKNTFGSALAASYATREKVLIKIIEGEASKYLSEDEIAAAKTASVVMAMNNSYYCFTHISSDKEFLDMPAGLVMSSLKNQKVSKIDFEVFSLAASIINSCSMCIDSHEEQLLIGGFKRKQIQMIAQISAVIAAVAQVISIE